MKREEYKKVAEKLGKDARKLGYRKIKEKDNEDFALRRQAFNGLYFVISGSSDFFGELSLYLEAKGRWRLYITDLTDGDISRAERELTERSIKTGLLKESV